MGLKNFCVLCAGASLCAAAGADPINISGGIDDSIEQTGAAFEGMIDYSFTGGTAGLLTISLTNTSVPDIGGFLTGFVFNIDSVDAGAVATLTSTTNSGFLNTGEEMASPFGMFDSGAALRANWTGGGNPSFGLGIGEMGLFEFSVSASDAADLSSSSFLGATGNDFAVRFRGLDGGGSDKLLVPAPGTASLALLGLGVATRRRRR